MKNYSDFNLALDQFTKNELTTRSISELRSIYDYKFEMKMYYNMIREFEAEKEREMINNIAFRTFTNPRYIEY